MQIFTFEGSYGGSLNIYTTEVLFLFLFPISAPQGVAMLVPSLPTKSKIWLAHDIMYMIILFHSYQQDLWCFLTWDPLSPRTSIVPGFTGTNRRVLIRATFVWWGCYALYPVTWSNQACPLLFFCCILGVCFCRSGPFNYISFHKFSPKCFRFLTMFFWSYFCLVGPFNYIKVPITCHLWFNDLWIE